MQTLKIKAMSIDTESKIRRYSRNDGTMWELAYEPEYKCWSIYQIDENGELVFGDPRGIDFEGSEAAAPTLTDALRCLRTNMAC